MTAVLSESADMSNLEAALALARQGVPVFPVTLAGGQKLPCLKGWDTGVVARSESEVGPLWTRFPRAGVGVAVGLSGFVVVDCDVKGGVDGVDWFLALCQEHGLDVSSVPRVRTPSGGMHLYFRQPAGEPLTNRRGSLPKKSIANVDIRGEGGFVVAPGSSYSDGAGSWELLPGAAIGSAPVCPDWLVKILRGKPEGESAAAPATQKSPAPQRLPGDSRSYVQIAFDMEIANVAGAVEGTRNETLNVAAFNLGQLVGGGELSQSVVEAALLSAASECGLDAKEAQATIASGMRAGLAKPRGVPERPAVVIDLKVPKPSVTGRDSFDPVTGEVLPSPIHWDGERRGKRPTWLVKDFFAESSVSLLIGESQAGKSFVAIELAGCMAMGLDFFERRTKAGGVLYAASEAVSTIPDRLNAFKLSRLGAIDALVKQAGFNVPIPSLPVSWVECPDLAQEAGVAALISWVQEANLRCLEKHELPLRLVVVDTLVAAFGIEDWNNAAQVQGVIRTLKRISAECNVAILGVHHLGKDLTRGAAGSFALTAGADTIVSVIRNMEDPLSGEVQSRNIALTKSRVGETGAQVSFTLESIQVDHDEEGEPVFSAFVKTEVTTRVVSFAKRPKVDSLAVSIFKRAFALAAPPADVASNLDGMSIAPLETIREHFYANYPSNNDDAKKCAAAKRQAFNRALKEIASIKGYSVESQDNVEVVVCNASSSDRPIGGANAH